MEIAVYGVPEHAMQLTLNLADQEEEPPPRTRPHYSLDVPSLGYRLYPTPAPSLPVSESATGISPRCRAFRERYFPHASDAHWSDWRWQFRNRIRDLSTLERMVRLTSEERAALAANGQILPMAITPHYMGLVSPDNPDQAIRRSAIPTVYEMRRCPGEADDPLCEDHQSPIPGLVHRYPDRVLLLATDACAVYCRYCTRSRVVGRGKIIPGVERLRAAFAYIRSDPQIRDVLISGGDPLSMSDNRLAYILSNLRAIPHVEIIRIGTRIPAVMPQRITPRLARLLRNFHPLFMSLHFLHPDECDIETTRACSLLADAGIPLGSQTVLLKGMNDDPVVMRRLVHALLRMRVRPYYLYQCDPIPGSGHFRTSVATGVDLIRSLRGFTTGYGVPTFVIDAPGGGGKIPIAPDYVTGKDAAGNLNLVNYEGKPCHYPDSASGQAQGDAPLCWSA